jgi:hypothetical protein
VKTIKTAQYDRREHSYYPPCVKEDWKNMQLVFDYDEEEVVCPAKADVCPVCHGKGKYVNPAIDSQGLTREDFEEDPDFADEYKSGLYDITCQSCGGKNVILVPDDPNSDCARQLEEIMKSEYETRVTEMAERRMGA